MRKIAAKFLIFLSLAISSCTAVSYVPQIPTYTPKVNLDVSPQTINKSVQIDPFKDASPKEDKKTPFMGLSVTDYELWGCELDSGVTNAVIADFSDNRLFNQVGRKVENPDFIIRGEIKKFYGKSQLSTFAKVSSTVGVAGIIGIFITPWALLAFLPDFVLFLGGIPASTNRSEMAIEMRLYDNEDNLINTYTGKSINSNPALVYRDQTLAVSNMTNRTFSKAIMQIRDQILADAARLGF